MDCDLCKHSRPTTDKEMSYYYKTYCEQYDTVINNENVSCCEYFINEIECKIENKGW
jgi:hypothetical protein